MSRWTVAVMVGRINETEKKGGWPAYFRLTFNSNSHHLILKLWVVFLPICRMLAQRLNRFGLNAITLVHEGTFDNSGKTLASSKCTKLQTLQLIAVPLPHQLYKGLSFSNFDHHISMQIVQIPLANKPSLLNQSIGLLTYLCNTAMLAFSMPYNN